MKNVFILNSRDVSVFLNSKIVSETVILITYLITRPSISVLISGKCGVSCKTFSAHLQVEHNAWCYTTLIPLIHKTNICFNQLLLGYSHNKSFCYIWKIGFVGLIDKYIFVVICAFFVLENMCYINVSKSTSFIRLNHNFFTIMKQITTFLVLKYIFL